MKKLFILIALFVSVQSFAQIETDTHVWKFRRKVTPLRSYESDPLCPFRI